MTLTIAPVLKVMEYAKRQWKMLHTRYRLSPDSYVNLWKKQNGRCRICGVEMVVGRTKKGNWKRGCCVDHIAWTHWVRGLLCYRCNSAIGYMKHDPKLLQSAIQYLHDTIPFPPK